MLNKERLDELLDYSPDSGLFTWKVNRRGKAKSRCIAGSKNGQGYILIKIDGKFYFAHRRLAGQLRLSRRQLLA